MTKAHQQPQRFFLSPTSGDVKPAELLSANEKAQMVAIDSDTARRLRKENRLRRIAWAKAHQPSPICPAPKEDPDSIESGPTE